jgi:hypothetical protein
MFKPVPGTSQRPSRNAAADGSSHSNLQPAVSSSRLSVQASLPERIAAQPIAFMRPSKFAASISMQEMPVFDAEVREQARKNVQASIATAMENKAYAESKGALERKLAARMDETLNRKCEDFTARLEGRVDSFYEQTAVRLGLLSDEIARHFSETLNQQMAETVNSLMAGWSEQNRALVNAECHAAMDRFAARLENLSSSRLEVHRKELQGLAANLKTRLQGVAHALEELGPAAHRS